MFAVCPRLTDEPDLGLLQLANDLITRPLFRPALSLLGDEAWSGLRDLEVNNADQRFTVRMQLDKFSPDEVKVTTDNKRLIVTAKHEEKEEKNCCVTRAITRIINIPDDVDVKSITSTMNSQGILKIQAEKKALESKERPIPVQYES